MTATAQLEAESGHTYDPHLVAVLLAEQSHGAACDRLFVRRVLLCDLDVRPDVLVHQPLHRFDLMIG